MAWHEAPHPRGHAKTRLCHKAHRMTISLACQGKEKNRKSNMLEVDKIDKGP